MNRREFLKHSSLAVSALYAGSIKAFGGQETDSGFYIVPDYTGPTETFRHSWRNVGNFDQFRWLVRRDAQEQLQTAHEELGIKHLRAVGMLDDRMRFYTIDPKDFRKKEKEPRLNLQIINYVIDSLLDIGINPMFTTCFMPSALASGEGTVFTTKSRISPPNDYDKWVELIEASVRHMIDRYGRQRVRNWYFEVWNESNLRNGFFEGDRQDFFKLWKHTYQAIKRVDDELKIGGPSTARGEWLAEMIEFGRKNSCEPDYIITHIYNNDNADNPASPFEGSKEEVKKNDSYASGVIQGGRKLLDELDYKGDIHWNEWGRSYLPYETYPDNKDVSPRQTPKEAAFIVKTMAEVSQEADEFAYWCLSDIYDQVGYGREAFFGHYGLMSLQGLRKPGYLGFQLLNRTGTQRLKVAGNNLTIKDNVLVTKSKDKYCVLVYSYGNDNFYPQITKNVTLQLPKQYRSDKIDLYRIGMMDNNIVTEWRSMDSPVYLSRTQLEVLKEKNTLSSSNSGMKINKNNGTISFEIESPGVALIEIPFK